MRTVLSIALSVFLFLGQALAAEQEAQKESKSGKEKLSYSLGYKTGSNMKNSSVDFDLEIYIKAFREGFAGDKPAMPAQEMNDTLRALQDERKAKQAEGMKQMPEKNKKAGA